MLNPLTPILLLIFFSPTSSSAISDTLNPSESLSFNQTLISASQTFELGFFPTNNRYYLGIWFYNLPVKTIVWVANRDSPARSSSISLNLTAEGRIFIAERRGGAPLWSTSAQSSGDTDSNAVLQLLDSGNLVIREAGSENYIWQSFDYPTDTLLPGQKIGWDRKTGLNRYPTSWSSSNDPSSGNYTFQLNRTGDPELILLKSGSQKIHRSGPWVGSQFSGIPEMKPSAALNFSFVNTPDEVYYSSTLLDPSAKFRVVLDSSGFFDRFAWVPDRAVWNKFWYAPKDQCDQYMTCGPNGVCDANELVICECPQGFQPKNPKAWRLRYWSDGCVRKTELDCKSDGFVRLKGMKLPESGVGGALVNFQKTLAECRETCRKDCNCTAYANAQAPGSGCIMWFGELLDLRCYDDLGGQNLYVRLAASDLGIVESESFVKKRKSLIISVSVCVGGGAIVVIALTTYFVFKRRHKSNENSKELRVSRPKNPDRSEEIVASGSIVSLSNKRDTWTENGATEELELPLFEYDVLALATGNFSIDNKVGQGGFGCVYKGVLVEGGEIAVKRLAKESGQGTQEFMNEVKVIAKLQHRNLVRLLGCCVESNEKMLVYEYLHNKSLHSVLFHKDRTFLLDWQTRFNVITGIARGLVYLHHDSRLRIVHRDLKASNVLLDNHMNPKISDFGMARIFGEDDSETSNTRRIVGTYGYMSPEYAMDGNYSNKSDVFSFGVLVLEIITGKKNKRFYNSKHELNLLGYAWKMWKQGKGTILVDTAVGDNYSVQEVLRCIQVALLCVQERPEERPTMSSVVLLLSTEIASLPRPKLPGFCMGWMPEDGDNSCCLQDDHTFTANQLTVTLVDGR